MSLPAAGRTVRAALSVLILFVLAQEVSAQTRRWSLETPSGPRTLAVAAQSFDGTPYVPLNLLIDQAGGVSNILPARIRVDLMGTTAWLRVGDRRVHALSIFSLHHPIREQNGSVYMAASDVPDFFLKSFRARVAEAAAPVPADEASIEPLETLSPSSRPDVDVQRQSAPQPSSAPETPTLSGRANVSLVLIDPGHGGLDPGYDTGTGAVEKTIALAVASKVIARADAIGEVSFRLTREQDVELSDAQRAAMLGQNPATLYVGLHAGTSFSPRVRGITLIHPSNRETAAASLPGMADRDAARVAASRRIARAIAPALNEAAGQPVRGIVSAPIRPLHGSVAPGVVIELGYLSNADDAALLATDAYQNRLADGIVAGLQRYLAADANGAGGGR